MSFGISIRRENVFDILLRGTRAKFNMNFNAVLFMPELLSKVGQDFEITNAVHDVLWNGTRLFGSRQMGLICYA